MDTDISKQTGLVSVVIPTYNYGEFITDALNALKNQTYSAIEVIIVDDGSTDGTITIVNNWRLNNMHIFKNFLYLKLPRNCSSSWSLNIGFYQARGEFIVIHDADDFSHPEKIKTQVNWLREHPACAAVGTNFNVVNINKQQVFLPGWLNFNRQQITVNYKEKSNHCVCFGTLMFRKDILKNVAGVKKIAEIRNDIIYIGELINYGYIVDNINSILFSVRLHYKQKTGPKDFQKASFNIFPQRVSIVIPVRYIGSILEIMYRIAVQSYQEIEVIIIDDTGQNETEILMNEWKSTYANLNPGGIIKDLIYFRLPVEAGNPWLYNIGSYLAKGKYIFFSGNNSLIDKDELLKQARILDNNWPYSGIAANVSGDKLPLKWNNDFLHSDPNKINDISGNRYTSVMIKKGVIDRTAGLAKGFRLGMC